MTGIWASGAGFRLIGPKGTPHPHLQGPLLAARALGAGPGGPGEDAQGFPARGAGPAPACGTPGPASMPTRHTALCPQPGARALCPLSPFPLTHRHLHSVPPHPKAAQPPPHSSEAASHANVFRIHDISETSICIYLDSISKELFKIGAIWIDGCGTDCFLSVHVKNTMFSKWITNAVIIEMGTFCWGKITES